MKPSRGMRKLDNCCNNKINHLNETKRWLQVSYDILTLLAKRCRLLVFLLKLMQLLCMAHEVCLGASVYPYSPTKYDHTTIDEKNL